MDSYIAICEEKLSKCNSRIEVLETRNSMNYDVFIANKYKDILKKYIDIAIDFLRDNYYYIPCDHEDGFINIMKNFTLKHKILTDQDIDKLVVQAFTQQVASKLYYPISTLFKDLQEIKCQYFDKIAECVEYKGIKLSTINDFDLEHTIKVLTDQKLNIKNDCKTIRQKTIFNDIGLLIDQC